MHPGAEVVDQLVVTEVGADLPVRGDRAEVDDLHVATGRLRLGAGLGQGHRDSLSGRRSIGRPA